MVDGEACDNRVTAMDSNAWRGSPAILLLSSDKLVKLCKLLKLFRKHSGLQFNAVDCPVIRP